MSQLLRGQSLGLRTDDCAAAATRSPSKDISVDGLTVNVPNNWPVYHETQWAACNVVTPAVIIGHSGNASQCKGISPDSRNTLVRILPAGGAQGTYAGTVAEERPITFPGETTKTRKFVHEGVSVVLQASHFSKAASAGGRIVWIVAAHFKGYPIEVGIGSETGGSSERQAIAIVETVRPSKVKD